MGFPPFDPAKHPHGFHGHFAPTAGGAAAAFVRGAARAKMHLAVKKPMAAEKPKAPTAVRSVKEHIAAVEKKTAAAKKTAASMMRAPKRGLEHAPEQAAAHLGTLGSRDEARQYLAKASRAELVDVAKHAGAVHYANANKTAITNAIVERAVGGRLDMNAVSGHSSRQRSPEEERALARGFTLPEHPSQRQYVKSPEEQRAEARRAAKAAPAPTEPTKAQALRAHREATTLSRQAGVLMGGTWDTPAAGTAPAPAKSAAAMMKGSATGTGADRHIAHLDSLSKQVTLSNRAEKVDQAKAYIAGVKGTELTALARHYKVTGKTVADKRAQILHATVRGQAVSQYVLASPDAAGPRMSSESLLPNTWGGMHGPNDIHYHEDGEIGRTVQRLGADAHLEVQGHALGNVLARIATDAVKGNSTAQEQVDRIRQVREQLPEGSAARRKVDHLVEALDAPHTPAPRLPQSTPAPLHQLAKDLHAVPLVRRDPSREQAGLERIAADFAAGRTGGMRLISAVRDLHNQRHESTEGKFEIDRAVRTALTALENMRTKDPKSLYPPSQR